MNKNIKIFICCTEQSGDNIVYNILKRIKSHNIQVDGVCGSKAEKFYKNKYFDIRDFKAMGFFEVIFSLKNYINKINFLTQKVILNKYDLIITVDSPDFNYQLVKKIRKNKFNKNIIHIVAPTVWAWRPGRAKKFSTIYKYDLISCIGAMTYTNNPKKLLKSMHNKLKDSGFLIFTHRVDLIIKQNFIKILEDVSNHWKVYYKSRPILYLPNNKDFKDKIKIKIILLKKIKSED